MVFAVAVVKLCRKIPDTAEGRHFANQLLRAGTGVGANYRAACRGRSKPDFIAKLGIVIEEADETEFWLDLMGRADVLTVDALKALRVEANELAAIFTQSQKTAKSNMQRGS
jgi:four helix bundle protein